VSKLEVSESALTRLKSYLDLAIRPEILDKVNLKRLLRARLAKARAEFFGLTFPDEEFFDAILDDFIGKESPEFSVDALAAQLRARALDGFAKNKEEADAFVSGRIPIKNPSFDKFTKEAAGLIYNHLEKKFWGAGANWIKKWKTQKRRHGIPFVQEIEDRPKNIELYEQEQQEELEKEPLESPRTVKIREEVEKGLKEEELRREGDPEQSEIIKMVRNFIQRQNPQERKIFEAILEKIFLAEKPKKIKELASELDMSAQTLAKYRDELQEKLQEYLKHHKERVREKGYIIPSDVPDYVEYLTDEDKGETRQFHLEKFIDKQIEERKKTYRRGISEKGVEVLKALAEGLKKNEVISKTDLSTNAFYELFEIFMDIYRKWYRTMEREACIRVLRRVARFIMAAGEEPEKREKKIVRIKVDEPESESIDSYKMMIRQNLPKKLNVTIHFTSDYSNYEVAEKQADPEKEGPNFKWKMIEGVLSLKRNFGQYGLYELDYSFTQDLNDDGSRKGELSSVLKVKKTSLKERPVEKPEEDAEKKMEREKKEKEEREKEEVRQRNELKPILDDYVNSNVLAGGPLNEDLLCPVVYTNTKTKKEYNSIDEFKIAFVGLAATDEGYKKLKEQYEERQRRIRLGPMIYTKKMDEVHDTLEKLKLELIKEKKKQFAEKDESYIKKLEIGIEEMTILLKKMISEKRQKDTERFEKTRQEAIDVAKEMDLLIEEKTEEKSQVDASMNVYAIVFPGPKSEKVKELNDLCEYYAKEARQLGVVPESFILRPRVTSWISKNEFKALLNTVDAIFRRVYKTKFKNLREKEMGRKEKSEERKSIEKRRDEDLKRLPELFYALVVDLRDRRNEFKKDHPEEFEDLAKKTDTAWLDDTNVMEEVRTHIQTVGHEREEEKEPKLRKEERKPVSIETFRELLKDVVYEKGFFAGLADRLKEVSLEPFESKEDQEKLLSELRPLGSKCIELQNTIKTLSTVSHRIRIRTDMIDVINKKINLLSNLSPSKFIDGLQAFINDSEKSIEDLEKELKELERPPTKGELGDTPEEQEKYKKLWEEKMRGVKVEDLEAIQKKIDDIKDIIRVSKNLLTDILRKAHHKPDIKLESIIEYMTKSKDKISKEIDEIKRERNISDDQLENLSKLEADNKEANAEYDKKQRQLAKASQVPAVNIAETLLSEMEYFSKLYNSISRMTWFPREEEPVFAADATDKSRESLRDKIVAVAKSISRFNIRAEESIKDALKTLRDHIRKFIQTYHGEFYGEGGGTYTAAVTTEKFEDWAEKRREEHEERVHEEWEKYRGETFITPQVRAEIDRVKKAILDLKTPEYKKLAEEDFNNLIEGMKQGLGEEITEEDLNEIAKQNNISKNQARVRLIQFRINFSIVVLDHFLTLVMDLRGQEKEEEEEEKEEKSKARRHKNKAPEEYKTMQTFVEKNIPGITKIEKEEKEEKPGKATARDIRLFVENAFAKKPESWRQAVKDFLNEGMGIKEYSLGEGRTKSKTKRGPPASEPKAYATESEIRDWTVDVLEDVITGKSSPGGAVIGFLSHFLDRQKEAHGKKPLDIGIVIETLVNACKDFYSHVGKWPYGKDHRITLYPMKRKEKLYRYRQEQKQKGHKDILMKFERLTPGSVDLYFESPDELDKFREHLFKMYDVINRLIAPDKLPDPPKDIKDPSRLPIGYWDLMDELKIWEEEKKPSSTSAPATPPASPAAPEEKKKPSSTPAPETKEPPTRWKAPGSKYVEWVREQRAAKETVSDMMVYNVARKFAGVSDQTETEVDLVLR